MRSGWPHTQDDHGRLPADERQTPFGPDISWPTGYSNLEYRDGDYRYQAQQAPQPASHGTHPYAAFAPAGYSDDTRGHAGPSPADFGYGDPGYTDLGYDGPASQDAGIAGTRTVRGYVEATQANPGYALPGAPQSRRAAPEYGQSAPGYGDSGHIELAYPLQEREQDGYAEAYHAADTYQQPWDYDQPLRYEGEEAGTTYPDSGGYGSDGYQSDRYEAVGYQSDYQADSYQSDAYQSDGYQSDRYEAVGYQSDYQADSYQSDAYQSDRYEAVGYQSDGYQPDGYRPGDYGSGGYPEQAYGSGDYNGSDLSRPGIDGPGYDLSSIIATGDFEAVGYDEPSYDRLSYDDPRYDDASRFGDRRHEDGRYDDGRYDTPAANGGRDDSFGARFDETRYDMPRFDETRLDSLWLPSEDVRENEPVGYGDDGFGTDTPFRSGYSDTGFDGGTDFAGQRPVADLPRRRLSETRFDLRADDVRMDHTTFDVPAFDETRIDNLRASRSDFRRAGTGLLEPAEAQPLSWPDETSLDAFTGLDLDEEPALELPAAFVRTAERRDDTGSRRAIGRRRGRSGDRRQWMALGAIAVVAAGAIGGVLMKYVFSGPSGPAHTVVAPNQAGPFTREPSLEKQMKVGSLTAEVIKTSAGQASDVVSAVYQEGSSAPGGDAQIFMFVGGKLASAAPATSVANFIQTYPGATSVPAGPLGGDAACAQDTVGGEAVAMCVWFDNDSFGELVSPTMTTTSLASTLHEVRPSLELYAK
jgi:hypothetical protein